MRNDFFVRFVVFYSREKLGWLGLGYLVAVLKQIEGVRVDAKFYHINEIDMACSDTIQSAPHFVGLPVLQAELCAVREFVKKLKPMLKNTHIALGNKEVTDQPELMMKWCPEADSVIIGEGEHSITELVKLLIAGKELNGCKGIYFRQGQNIIKNEERNFETNIDGFPFPDRDIAPPSGFNEYLKMYPVITTRGCKGRCSFCVAYEKSMVRVRSMNSVFDEIDELIKKYDASFIIFGDSSFEDGGSTPVERYSQLLQTIKDRGTNIRFLLNCRTETISQNLIDILKELVDYGLDWMNVGIESGNEADLRLYAKRAKLSDNINALQLLSGADIPFRAEFIMFNPYSTFEGLRENIALLSKFCLADTVQVISSRFQAFSGARLTKKLFKDNLMKGNVEYPVTDGYCYNFLDRRIEQAWATLEIIKDKAPIVNKINGQEITNIFSLGRWLDHEKSPYKNDEKVARFISALESYKNSSNVIYSSLFEKVLDYAQKGKSNIVNLLESDIQNMSNTFESHLKEISKHKLLISMMLKRAGDLPIRNHI